jgi:prolyl oligopeptidase
MADITRLLFGIFLALAAASVTAAQPIARVEPVTDTYFGEKVVDRYRWMENTKDPDWTPYLKGQDAHARSVLGALPLRGQLLGRIRQLSGDIAMPLDIQRAGARTFYRQRPVGSNNFKLFVLESGKTRLLIDPTVLDTATSHVSLDWWSVSPDGSKLAYGLSRDGSEDSVLHILDVASGSVLPERIPGTQVGYPSWLPDNSGFFYNQLTGKVNTPGRYLDSRARLHRLGHDPAKDPIVVARGSSRALKLTKSLLPFVFVTSQSRHALLMLSDERNEKRIMIAPLQDVLKGRPRWKPVAGFDDDVTNAELHGDDLYLLTYGGHPRGRVVKVKAQAPSLPGAQTVVPESNLVLCAPWTAASTRSFASIRTTG